MLQGVTPCDRLLADRANNLLARKTGITDTYDSISDDDLAQIIEGLTRVRAHYDDWMRPATETEIMNALADIADMLQCSVPNASGIALYRAAMAMPAQLLEIAKVKVAANHRYARLPLPRDFLNAVDGELSWCLRKRSWVNLQINDFTRAAARRTNHRRTDYASR